MNEALTVSSFSPDNQSGVSTLANPISPQEGQSNQQTPPEGGTPQQNQQTTDPAPVNKEQQTPPAENTPPVPAPQTQDAASNTLKGVGLDITEFEQEFMSQGELSEASYKKLTDAGIPKAMVDSYIKGQEAIAQKMIDDVHAIAGGTESYAAMSQWAAQHIPQDELVAFNHVMASGKKELITLAVTGMVSRWKAAVGSQPKLTQGRVSGSGRVQGFASTNEMVKAMQDKRYGNDPAYTRAVEDRVARSNIFG